MITSHATTEARQRTRGSALSAGDGEVLSNRSVLIATRKQIDEAYKRICGGEARLLKAKWHHSKFGKANEKRSAAKK